MAYFRDNIDQLSGYVPGFQPRGDGVIKLNTNENPYPPSPAVMQAIASVGPEKLRRYPQPLADSFRKAAAGVLGVPAECILATNGGDELLTICLRAFCDENRSLVYPGPTYSLYPVLAAIQNCQAVELPFTENGDFDDAAIEAAAGGLVIVCNPNAPSGHFLPPDRLSQLATRLQDKSVLLVDEAYVDFAPDDCINLTKKQDNIIILRSMSKGYSLAGLRFGYGVACESLITGLLKVKDSYNVDALAIAAATAAIKDQVYMHKNVALVLEERERMTNSLRDMGFEVPESAANFVLARVPDGNAAELHEALARRKIYVRYFPYEGLTDKLRITVGTQEQNDALLAALDEILASETRER